METSVFPKQRIAGVIKKLGPSSALQGTELRKHLRNFKKVYRNKKLGKSDFKKFRKKKQTKMRNYDIMRTSRTHQKPCYQSFIRSRNLLKLQLIDEEAYRRVCEKNKSDTSKSVATAISSNSVHSIVQDFSFSLYSPAHFSKVVSPNISNFRKMSCSSTANLYPSSSQNTLKHNLSYSNQIKPKENKIFNNSQNKSKNKKNITFSVDKAASPVINRCFSFELKTPKADAFQIWEDCNFNLFSQTKEEDDHKHFGLKHFIDNFELPESDLNCQFQDQNLLNEFMCSTICLDCNCGSKFCLKHWGEAKNSFSQVETHFELLDQDLGQGKSVSLIKSLITAKKEILRNYSEFSSIKKIRKKKSKTKKRGKKKVKNITPFLQTYKKKWEKVFKFGGSKFKNQLILNPLIFKGVKVEPVKKSQKKSKSSKNNQKNLKSLMQARPRFSLQHRRKSSLFGDSPPDQKDIPLEIKLCKDYHEKGFCKNHQKCKNLHNFYTQNKYRELLRRFKNIIVWRMKKGEELRNVLNQFHSLHRPLAVFEAITFRRPETCIFDLLT